LIAKDPARTNRAAGRASPVMAMEARPLRQPRLTVCPEFWTNRFNISLQFE
jgi:hypothetical protein